MLSHVSDFRTASDLVCAFNLDNKNRIRLKDNGSDSDYINASLIEYPEVSQRYIAAQAPLAGSIDNFWHMIGQYRVRVVAMLCSVVENSIVSCSTFLNVKNNEQFRLNAFNTGPSR